MLLDNVKFHPAKRLQPILKRFEHRIELLFLPPYSPDLNPIERVWWLMRKQITHNRWLKTMEQRVEEFEKWCSKTQPKQITRICNLIENIY
jgi:putative transposase